MREKKNRFPKTSGVTEELDAKALEQKRVLLASPLTPAEYVLTEYFARGTEPTEQSDYWVVPNAPHQFNVTLNKDDKPVISFVPQDTFAVYMIMKSVGGHSASAVQQIQTGALDPVEWIDTDVIPGETYQYYIIPVHPEMKLDGAPVQGPQTNVITVEIPEKSFFDGNFWDGIFDWFNPGDNQGNEELPDNYDNYDNQDEDNSYSPLIP